MAGATRSGSTRRRTTPRGSCRLSAWLAIWLNSYRSDDNAGVFRALADPTRRTILDELAERDGQTLFEICIRLTSKHGLSSTRQAISQHLDVLEEAGLVRVRREGRYKFHDLNTEPLEAIGRRWPRRRPAEDTT